MKARALVAVLCLVPAPLSAQAQSGSQIPKALLDRPPLMSLTRHSGIFGGQVVNYWAAVQEHLLEGPDSIPNATLVTIAYVRDGRNRATRPVAFVFNGGPGASSSPMHFDGFGPRVAAAGGVASNPHSILDATDLVFIDPVGTGFSRPYSTDIGKKLYWNQNGDAAAVTEVVRRWLRANGRERSPRYLIGASYGTVRIGAMLQNHPDMKYDGVVLVSALGGGDSTVDAVSLVPPMAVAAWYHDRIPRAGRTLPQMWDESLRFALGDYAAALAKGPALSASENKRVAESLSALIGLPAKFIEEKKLRLTTDDWLLNVLKDRDLRVSSQDTRQTGALVLDSVTASRMSRSLGLGGTAPLGQPGAAGFVPALVPGSDTALVAQRVQAASTLEAYLENDLQFRTIEAYRGLNLDINPSWYTGGQTMNREPARPIAERMRADTAMRMFWIQGYFDLNTPAYAALQSFERNGMPKDRMSGIMAPGPHSVFVPEESKQMLSAALRKWITQR